MQVRFATLVAMTTKERVRAWFEGRFFLRIHMTLILTGTFVAGVVTTRVLMLAGVNTLAVRYAIAISLAYLVFLALVKLWLMYVGSGGFRTADAIDGIDQLTTPLPGDHSLPAMGIRSGGVRGSGSSGSLDLDLDFGDDLGGIVLLVLILIIVVVLGGLAIYFIYTAPALLSEAAFEAVLAASIARRAKQAEGSGWMRVIFRATVWPFLAVLALSVLLGWYAQRRCPEALKLRDAIHCDAQRASTKKTSNV